MSFMGLIVGFTIPILFAVLLNELRGSVFKRTVQTISYLPHFVSWVVVAGIVTKMLSTDGGAVNQLMWLGFIDQPIQFMAQGNLFWYIVTGSDIWKEMGWSAIIYLAPISGIDQEQFEATKVDGASRLRQIWHITPPSIAPTIAILMIMSIGHLISIGFEKQFLLGNPLVVDYSQVLDLYALNYGLGMGRFSFGTAIGMFNSIVSILLLLANGVFKNSRSNRLCREGSKMARTKTAFKPTLSDRVFDIGNFTFMTLVMIVTLYPFLNVLAISLNDSVDTVRGDLSLAAEFTLENYVQIFKYDGLITGAKITILRTLAGTFLGLLSGTMLGYVLSRVDFQGRKFMSTFLALTMYFSGGMIPVFILIRDLNMMNSFLVYIIPGMVSAFNVFVIRSFIDSLPYSPQESAKLDGANDFTIYYKIILPLCKPVLATIALFLAVGQWNSWFDTYLYNGNAPHLTTLQFELMKVSREHAGTNQRHDVGAEHGRNREAGVAGIDQNGDHDCGYGSHIARLSVPAVFCERHDAWSRKS